MQLDSVIDLESIAQTPCRNENAIQRDEVEIAVFVMLVAHQDAE